MAFTSWAAIRSDAQDAIADYIGGSPCTKEYEINGKHHVYRSIEELKELIKLTYEMEALETAGSTSSRVSYGRHRRFD